MEIQRPRLRNAVRIIRQHVARRQLGGRRILHAAVDLVGGGIDEDRIVPGVARRLQHVEGAQGVDLEIGPRVGHRGRDRGLRGQVIDRLLSGRRRQDRRVITDVAPDEAEAIPEGGPQPIQVRLAAPPRQIVEDRDLVAGPDARLRQVAPDEPGAAGNQNAHLVPLTRKMGRRFT